MKKNRIYRKYLAVFMLFCFAALMSACGKTEKTDGNAQDAASMETVSRSEFVGMLGGRFGYQESEAETSYFDDVDAANANYAAIQACAEWEVIPAGGAFRPEDDVTLGEALEAAVKAIDLEDIRRAGYEVDGENLPEFFAGNIANIDTKDLGVALDYGTAAAIVEYASDFCNNLEFPQVVDISLKDGVKTAGLDIRLNYDGQTGSFLNEGAYEVGDIVYWGATDTTLAKGIRITNVDGTSFQYVDAEVTDVYGSMNISGTFPGRVVSVTTASEGTRAEYDRIYDDVKGYGMMSSKKKKPAEENTEENSEESSEESDGKKDKDDSRESDKDKPRFEQKGELGIQSKIDGDSVIFYAYAQGESKSYDESGTPLNAKAKMDLTLAVKNIKVTVDYQHADWSKLAARKVDVRVNYDTEVTTNFTGGLSKTIALGEIDIYVVEGFFVRVSLIANVGADGRLTVSYETKNVMGTCWQKGKGMQKSFTSTPSLTFEAEVTLTAEATVLVDVRIGFGKASLSVINAEVTSGAVAIAKRGGDLLNGKACTDILIYVPLRWGLNQRSCLVTDISSKLKYKMVIWDSSNAPIKIHFHFEDGKRTEGDECTRGKEEEVVQEDVDENGDPFAELELFEFEPMNLEFIEFTSPLVFLKEGEADRIGYVSLPDGYTEADLEYTVESSSVCTVSGGNISAVSAGSTLVTVRTKDGVYTAVFAVTVFPDYIIDDFTPIV